MSSSGLLEEKSRRNSKTTPSGSQQHLRSWSSSSSLPLKMMGGIYQPRGLRELPDYIATLDESTKNVVLFDPETDSEEYKSALESVHVAKTPLFVKGKRTTPANRTNGSKAYSLECHCTQKELVTHALSRLCRKSAIGRSQKHGAQQNVLSLGYSFLHNSDNGNVVDAPQIANFYPNTLVNIFQNATWVKILSRIGEELMLHLLIDCSVFMSLPNGCFVQLNGPSVHSVVAATKQSATKRNREGFEIPRSNIFYVQSFPRSCGLPNSHFAGIPGRPRASSKNAKKTVASRNSARELTFRIFMATRGQQHKRNASIKRLPRHLVGLVPFVQTLLNNHYACEYGRLLNKHCAARNTPSRNPASKSAGPGGAARQAELDKTLHTLTGMRSNPGDVARYVWSVVDALLPPAFWGSKHNKKMFRGSICNFVSANRNDVVPMEGILRRVKTQAMGWLAWAYPSASRLAPLQIFKNTKALLQRFVLFLYKSIIIPLIRHDFYVTEVEGQFNAVAYYRRPVWTKIHAVATELLKGKNLLQTINFRGEKSAGVGASPAPLRFLPKKRTVRPITNMSKRQKCQNGKHRQTLSINQRLGNVFKALCYETEKSPESLGAAVFGHDDIFKRLAPFLKGHRGQKLYFVALDVKTCYDSISQEKCFDIVKNMLRQREYVFQKYSAVHPEPADRSVRTRFVRQACALGQEQQFFNLATNKLSREKHSSVFTDGVVYASQERDELVRLLKSHIFNNIVQVAPGKVYLQGHGIPQGSVLSSLMCNLYYGRMERLKFPELLANKPGGNDSVLVRLVDDYLLVSTKQSVAENFVHSMHQGVPEFALVVKKEKTKVNFGTFPGSLPEGEVVMTWCGWRINTATGEFRGDYSKYENVEMRNVVNMGRKGGAVGKKMRSALKPKCHALLFDRGLNSERTVYLNAFEILTIAAVKFHSMVTGLERQNSKFFKSVINDTIMYSHWLIEDRCAKFGLDSGIKRCELGYLGSKAFHYILSRKQSRYKAVLQMLEGKIVHYETACGVRVGILKEIASVENIALEMPVLKSIKF
jgi:telomerase reverse transcriptase